MDVEAAARAGSCSPPVQIIQVKQMKDDVSKAVAAAGCWRHKITSGQHPFHKDTAVLMMGIGMR